MNLNLPILSLKLVRRSIRRFQATQRFGPLTGSPILFANSFPKSGTHLLTQILNGFQKFSPIVDSGLPPILTFDGPTGKPRSLDVIIKELRRLKDGDIGYGHLHAHREVAVELTKTGMATYFIFRDPRDVVVSHVHYITEMYPEHAHHRYYTQELETFDERLKVSILGLPGTSKPFPDIGKRFDPYLGWFGEKNVLTLRYEDFINTRDTFIENILDHAVLCGLSLEIEQKTAVRILSSVIDPKRSPTFRSGKIGKWRDAFSNEHIKLFKDVAGDLLLRLRYEKDFDW